MKTFRSLLWLAPAALLLLVVGCDPKLVPIPAPDDDHPPTVELCLRDLDAEYADTVLFTASQSAELEYSIKPWQRFRVFANAHSPGGVYQIYVAVMREDSLKRYVSNTVNRQGDWGRAGLFIWGYNEEAPANVGNAAITADANLYHIQCGALNYNDQLTKLDLMLKIKAPGMAVTP